jgi:hypothetical protein
MTRPSDTTKAAIRPESAKYFDAEALGASLRQLAVDVVKGESTDFMSRWFRSSHSDADLVIWTDGEKRIIKHQLCFYGQVVEWNPISGTRTGLVIEEEVLEGQTAEQDGEPPVKRPEPLDREGSDREIAETIRFDKSAQGHVIKQAIQLLGFVHELPENDRSMLIYHLRESPKLHKNARERALKIWAPKADELTSDSTRRPNFWKRLRTWVLGE